MKRLVPLPCACSEHLKNQEETGFGYQVVSVRLKDERVFEQVVVSENCIIEVRGYKEIPFAAEDVVSVSVTHQHWNFRDQSDSHTKSKAASA